MPIKIPNQLPATETLTRGDHTLMLRFRLDYSATYWGWFVASGRSGTYLVGQADYAAAGQRTLLHVNLAGQSFNLPDRGELQVGRWYHLALVVTGSQARVFLDGAPVKTVPLHLPPGEWSSGPLLLGQRVGVPRLEQFYGQLADVAVWPEALTERDIQRASRGQSPAAPAWKLPSDARPVSSHRMVPLRFPLEGIWKTIQGFSNGPGSHVGYAAFCYDFGGPAGAEVRAAASGTVVKRVDGHPAGPGPSNEVVLQHTATCFTSYLHLQAGSLRVQPGQQVRPGQPLGRVGSSGTGSPHLHFTVLYQRPDPDDNGADLTCPFTFSDTEVRPPGGAWRSGPPHPDWEVRATSSVAGSGARSVTVTLSRPAFRSASTTCPTVCPRPGAVVKKRSASSAGYRGPRPSSPRRVSCTTTRPPGRRLPATRAASGSRSLSSR